MARQIIPRTDKGQYEYHPNGIEDFAKRVAKELCETYPNIDMFDLELIFNRQFTFAMTMELLRNIKE